MLAIQAAASDVASRYVCQVLFGRWSQWPIVFQQGERSNLVFTMLNAAPGGITLGGVGSPKEGEIRSFFARVFSAPVRARLRAEYGETLLDVHGAPAWLDDGAVAAIFWLLSGGGEQQCLNLDQHGRVPASSSLLVELDILDLPVVDLLADYLIGRIRAQWPALPAPVNRYRVVPTHDVDAPFKYAFCSPVDLARRMLGDVMRGGQVGTAWRAPRQWWAARRGQLEQDPYNCFSRMLSIHEAHGLVAEFYFIAGHSGGRIDGDYDLAHPFMRRLLRDVSDRGHLVGLHASYNAPFNEEILRSELQRLQRIASEEGYAAPIDMIRNHYLRFHPLMTPAIQARCGFLQDSTLGYADVAGFRRGTCRSFPLWDPVQGQALALIERPLVAMECSLIATRYQGMTYADAAGKINRLKAECQRFGGEMVILWHNNYLTSEQDFELFEHALS